MLNYIKIKEQEMSKSFSEREVLEIVDSCFHCYASSFRNDAKKHAQELMSGEPSNECESPDNGWFESLFPIQ